MEELVNKKHRVFALVRKTSKVDLLENAGVDLLYGDITDEKSLQHIKDYKIDAVFHCAGHVKEDNWKTLFYANVKGTENICNLCLDLKVERLIHVSSVAVVSGNQQVPLREDAPYAATNLYGASKIDAEKKAIEFRTKGLRVAIIRPPMVYGEGEPHALGRILYLLKHRLLPLVGEGRAKWHLAYVKNVVAGLMLALDKEECLESSYFVADEEVLTVKEVFSILSESVHGSKPFVLPAMLTSALLKVPVIGPKFSFFLKDRVYDIKRIKSLGFYPPCSCPKMLAQTASHWLKEIQG